MEVTFNGEFILSFIHTLQRTASIIFIKSCSYYFKQGHLVASIEINILRKYFRSMSQIFMGLKNPK
jgi:hypothetical protein